jgi:hypothetical protein
VDVVILVEGGGEGTGRGVKEYVRCCCMVGGRVYS